MERLRRLQTLWNWLPTYRAVAEHEHVSNAASRLGVSPSAVSRMISLLEEDVGQPLFERVGRRIELNEAGQHLLIGVRNAMRMVDESLAQLANRQFVGPVRIAIVEPFSRVFLGAALSALRASHPGLIPQIQRVAPARVTAELLEGSLDVALVRATQVRDQITIRRLGELSTGVYAAPDHPLAEVTRCTLEEVGAHAFVELGSERKATTQAIWPVAVTRRVAAVVDDFDVASALVQDAGLLAVLPDRMVQDAVAGGSLKRLPINGTRPIELFAVWRQKLELPGRADAVVEAIEAIVGGRPIKKRKAGRLPPTEA